MNTLDLARFAIVHLLAQCKDSDAPHYAVLEIEYHYLCLLFVTHCVLTLCHACPLTSASDEVKRALWSWCIKGNKGAHAIIRLFNTFSRSDSHHQGLVEVPLPALKMAPDRTFAMVVVAVLLILRHQVGAYEYGRRRGLAESPSFGFTRQAENSIRRAIERMEIIGHVRNRLDDAQVTCDHPAARYVEILEALLRIWEEKRSQKMMTSIAAPADHACPRSITGFHHNAGHQSLLHGGDADDLGSMQTDLDLSLFGGDFFSDAAFPWDGLDTLDWQSSGPYQ